MRDVQICTIRTTADSVLAIAGGPLPRFDGITGPLNPPTNVPPSPLQPQASGGPIRVPPLAPDKAAQYAALFDDSGAVNGLLLGIPRPKSRLFKTFN